jgi:hypothetical protein
MEPGRLDTFVLSGKTKRSTRKPKARQGFIGIKFFGPEKVFFNLTGTYMDDSFSSCQPLEIFSCSVSYGFLKCQYFNFLWPHSSIVNTNIINQAGEETTCIEVFCRANVQATI